jgi:hydrogenase maturation protease
MFPDHPSPPRIVIAGVGNVSAGIDPFATELVRALTHVKWPEGVRVADYGLRQVDLTYTLAEEADVAILLDTIPHGKAPGTMEVVRPDTDDLAHNSDKLTPRPGLSPATVVRMVRALGGKLRDTLLVECEPSPARSAAKEIARRVEALVNRIRAGEIGQLFPVNVDANSAAGIAWT